MHLKDEAPPPLESPVFGQPLHVGRPNIGDRAALMKRIEGILDRLWFSNHGPLVQEFEQRVAQFLGVKHCVAMCNGTIALEIAIRACDLRGEVIVPSYTFVATAHALQWLGLTPVFADIDLLTHNLAPDAVERMVSPRTSGIIGVHLWGRPAPIEELSQIAERHRLQLLFDAAHAFGCSHRGRSIGNFGRCEVLSFHATKFFNTFEGGAVVTNDDELASRLRLMTNFGFAGYDNVVSAGTNGKMTEVCAAMGLTGLERIDELIAINKRNYLAYREAFSELRGISLITHEEAEKCNYQYIVVEVSPTCPLNRDEIVNVLHERNVFARKYFWPGCHNMMPYRSLYPEAGLLLSNTNIVAERVVVFPTGRCVDQTAITEIASIIRTAALERRFTRTSP
jgi:dTDP-4-amino-4,6-dideoxygalactose transaminase